MSLTFTYAPKPAWMDRAQCRGLDGFTEIPVADQIMWCRGCPVRVECADYGLDEPVFEDFVWGALHPEERKQLKKSRPTPLRVLR